MISSTRFALTAKETLNLNVVRYCSGGNRIDSGMDSAGFISYCLMKNGIQVAFRGTNDLYRSEGTRCIPLKEAMSRHLIVPGVILLHVVRDGGEPPRYQADGKGNCDYAAIAISQKEAAYPSLKAGKLISIPIIQQSGKPNFVLFSKHVDYNASENPDSPKPSAPSSPAQENPSHVEDGVFTKVDNLRLRKAPSMRGDCIVKMPKGARVDLLEYRPDWCRVRYRVSDSLYHDGWCASEYLTLD